MYIINNPGLTGGITTPQINAQNSQNKLSKQSTSSKLQTYLVVFIKS